MSINGLGGFNTATLMNLFKLQVNAGNSLKGLEQLATGLRINRAADDAAGLAVADKFSSQIRGYNRASSNVQDGVSMLQTADGSLSTIQDSLGELRELTIQAGNGAYTDEDIKAIEQQASSILAGIDDMAKGSEFNTKKLLDGSSSGKVSSATSGVDGFIRGELSDYGSFSGRVISSMDQKGNLIREVELTARGGKTYKASLDDNFRANNVITNLDLQLDKIDSAKLNSKTNNLEAGFKFLADINATFSDADGDSFSLSYSSGTAISRADFLEDLNNGFTSNNVDLNASFDSNGNLSINSKTAGDTFSVSSVDGGFSSAFGLNNSSGNESITGSTKANIETAVISFANQVKFAVSDGSRTSLISVGGANQTLSTADLKDSINNQLRGAGINVRFDLQDSGFSFESSAIGSNATISVSDQSTGNSNLANSLGFSDSRANGSGASSFTLNVMKTGLTFQNGANQGQASSFSFGDFRSNALGIANFDFSSQEGRDKFLGNLDRAINSVSSARSSIGSQQNAFDNQFNNLFQSRINATRSESMIRDLDFAKAFVEQSNNDLQRQAMIAAYKNLTSNTNLLLRLL